MTMYKPIPLENVMNSLEPGERKAIEARGKQILARIDRRVLSPEERTRREEAIREAVTGARLAGATLDPEWHVLAQRYIEGEIDVDGMVRTVNDPTTKVFADGFEGHKKRSLERAAKMEKGERLESEKILTFADPLDMAQCLGTVIDPTELRVRMDEESWQTGYNAGYASPRTPPEVPEGVTDYHAFWAGVIEGQGDKQTRKPASS
jgi:hypothetical protein